MKEITKLEKTSQSDFTLCMQSFYIPQNVLTAILHGFISHNFYLIVLYIGPYASHALKSWPSLSEPNAFHAAGRKSCSSGTLCIHTGIRRMEASVMISAPIWP